jgi:hypothetical protein
MHCIFPHNFCKIMTSVDSDVEFAYSALNKRERLVEWSAELLHGLLRKITVNRSSNPSPRTAVRDTLADVTLMTSNGQFVDEVTEAIEMPDFDERYTDNLISIDLGPAVRSQLRQYVTWIASLYRDNAFHNFEHACHVAMSASKLLNRIIAPSELYQASDVAHTMQHWHIYQRWNKRLFDERYSAFLAGWEPTDPSIGWYKGEIWFFDNYIIPLAKKLEECKVFGVSCEQCLTCAMHNRCEWELKGEDIVREMMFSHRRGSFDEDSKHQALSWNVLSLKESSPGSSSSRGSCLTRFLRADRA